MHREGVGNPWGPGSAQVYLYRGGPTQLGLLQAEHTMAGIPPAGRKLPRGIDQPLPERNKVLSRRSKLLLGLNQLLPCNKRLHGDNQSLPMGKKLLNEVNEFLPTDNPLLPWVN